VTAIAHEAETAVKYVQAKVDEELHRAVLAAARQDHRSVTQWVNVQLERAVRQQVEQKRQVDN
jgi:predicted HicB family RNase H-like nuclease